MVSPTSLQAADEPQWINLDARDGPFYEAQFSTEKKVKVNDHSGLHDVDGGDEAM